MARRTEYTDEYKTEAVLLARRLGINPAAKELDIPYPTLYSWMDKPEYITDIEVKKETLRDGNPLKELTEKLNKIANLSADRIIEVLEGNLDNIPLDRHGESERRVYELRDLNTVLGTSADKLIKIFDIGRDKEAQTNDLETIAKAIREADTR